MELQLKKSYRVVAILLVCFFLLFVLASIAARIYIPQILESECSKILGVPVTVGKAGINFLNTSFWIRNFEIKNVVGAEEKTFLSFKHLTINLGFTSLLARQLIFEKIRFQDPVLNIERNANGQLNLAQFQENIENRFRPHLKLGRQYFFTGYEIRHLSIKNGAFRYVNHAAPYSRKRWSFHHIDFSFSNFAYPPQFVDPIPTSLYLNAKIDGIREGSILVLGSGNFFAGKKNFRVRSDLKNVALRDLNPFFPSFPLLMTDGFLDLKSTFTSKEDWFVLNNEAEVQDLKLADKPGLSKVKTAFGFPKKDLIDLFQTMRGRPFNFDFVVSKSLDDPTFRLRESLNEEFSKAVEIQLIKAFKRLRENTLGLDKGVGAGPTKPKSSLQRAIEQWTGVKLPKD